MARKRSNTARYGWERASIQLGGGVIFGVLVPFAAAVLINRELTDDSVFFTSLAASLIAVIVGAYLFRSLISFPGIREIFYVLPVFSSTFGMAGIAFLMLRVQYSRPLLAASYLACLLWYYAVVIMVQRRPSLHIAVVPFGAVEELTTIPGIRWERLAAPILARSRAATIVADFRVDMPEDWQRFLADAALSGVAVIHCKQLRESLTGRVEIEHLSENAHGTLAPPRAYQAAKHLTDFVVILLLFVPLLPVLGLIGALIRLDSPGPVFFRQTRIGQRGAPFVIWKFRTMTHMPEPAGGDRAAAITQSHDQRITRVGRYLRRTRLDELPQVINVLLGQMSLIGPRPEMEVLSQWYEREIPFYRYRHIARPGITGWAQVNQGHVAEISDVHDKLHYDFFYISNLSLWLDILVTVKTIKTVVTGFGHK